MQDNYNSSTDSHSDLLSQAQSLLTATSETAEEKVIEARKRLTAALETSRELWANVQAKTNEVAQVADNAVRERPYTAVGIAFGVGAVLGLLLARRK